MSGIYGAVYGRKNAESIDCIPMGKWNQAYGREQREFYKGESVHMGCCLEKLSEKAIRSTPVLKRDGKIAVIDAVLYSRVEMQEKIGIAAEISDEELLLIYIEKFGVEALENVNGDFAGAVYEETADRLILFRDHMGVRPLFYFLSNEMVAFSTDIRGLTALESVDTTLSEEWIFETVAGYSTNATNTEFANIFQVEHGGYIIFSLSEDGIKPKKNRYWKWGQRKVRFSSDEEYQRKLRELVTDAVKRRLDATSGLVGAELSGGLDSGVIDILINRLGREGVYFSWSMDPDIIPMAEEDERLVIRDICEQEKIVCNYSKGTEHLNEDSNIAESMRQIGVTVDMEQSAAFRYALPPYINALTLCETSQFVNRAGAKVVFTGHGGDEGVSHRCNPYELYYHREYVAFFRHFWELTEGQPRRFIRTLKHCRNNICESQKRFGGPFHRVDGVPELLKKEFAQNFKEEDMPRITFAYDPKTYVKNGGSCNRLLNVAILGAYCGVRYMVPFADYRIMDFALSIPRSQYMKHQVKRYIYREAFKDIMPDSLYTRALKQSNSSMNFEPNPNWYEEFAAKKQETIKMLDRSFWEQYLDYDEIDAFLKRGKPSDEEKQHEKNILTCLFYCAMIENLVKKSKEVGKDNCEE